MSALHDITWREVTHIDDCGAYIDGILCSEGHLPVTVRVDMPLARLESRSLTYSDELDSEHMISRVQASILSFDAMPNADLIGRLAEVDSDLCPVRDSFLGYV